MSRKINWRIRANLAAWWGLILILANTTIIFCASNDTDVRNELPIEVEDDWVAPESISKEFPYYISGYDKEGRPVVVFEAGSWDFRKTVEAGGMNLVNLHKHILRVVDVIKKIPKQANNWQKGMPENGTDIDGAILIVDMDIFATSQITSSKTLMYLVQLIRLLSTLQESVHRIYFINVNYTAQTFLNLVKPILGSFFEKIDIHGTNKARWIPALLQSIPQNQLPPYYGGSQDFKPLVFYG